ncbi:hypothetical protein AB0K00_45360 [Dactylosporangium sp. NPDC049525]|uniref:hypothetical protein n=1 Tax=Dactylosporangium sp. NPDC049525 TaxID=3154730 RepID=UPI00342C4B4E
MTLILSLLTRQFVIQVSDRRLTKPDGTIHDDEVNKTAFYSRNASVAFTGLAFLGRDPTADWMLESLAQGSTLIQALRLLQTEATKKFRNLQRPQRVTPDAWRRIRRATFVTAGFAGLHNPQLAGLRGTIDELHPFMSVISNAEWPDGSWEPEAGLEFKHYFGWLPDGVHFQVRESGLGLSKGERRRLDRELSRCLPRVGSPEPAARILARAVREAADRHSGIGKSVVSMLITRNSPFFVGETLHEGNAIPVRGHRQTEEAMFRTMPDAAPMRFVYSPTDMDTFMHYSPNTVMPGLAIKSAELRKHDDDITVDMRMRARRFDIRA